MYGTNYFETMVLNVLRGTQAAAPSAVYVGLFVTDPGEMGEGSEVAYSGYKRQKITFAAPEPMENGIGIQNATDITFPIAPSAAGTITHLGIFDAQTTGNMLIYGALADAQAIEAQEAPVIVAKEAKWYLTGNMSDHFKTAVLNIIRGITLPGVVPYLALFDGDPDKEGHELSGEKYERLKLTFTPPQEQDDHECRIWTTEDVSTARAPAVWGTWAQTVVMDAPIGGHPLFGKPKSPAKVMRAGLLVTVKAGALSLAVN